MLKKTTYYFYNQKKTHLYKKEKTQLKTSNSGKIFAIHIKDKRLVFMTF